MVKLGNKEEVKVAGIEIRERRIIATSDSPMERGDFVKIDGLVYYVEDVQRHTLVCPQLATVQAEFFIITFMWWKQ